MKEIIIATNNDEKKLEMIYALRNLKVKILSLDNFPEIGEIEESGSTLLENSLIKSRKVQRITGIPAIADDTGLEVEFLNGAPGVKSARYGGDITTKERNKFGVGINESEISRKKINPIGTRGVSKCIHNSHKTSC